jgi:hypothetical protein
MVKIMLSTFSSDWGGRQGKIHPKGPIILTKSMAKVIHYDQAKVETFFHALTN